MIRVFLILCCFLCVQQDEPAIAWNTSYKLSWADFKDKPNPKMSAVAVTASGITFGFSVNTLDNQVVSFTSEVHAHFYPEKSWYKKEMADTHVLEHEQLHFDITELHARKFRQRIDQIKISNRVPDELRAIHDSINKALSQMQRTYDSETNYSRDVEAQAKWKIYVTKALKTHSKYKLDL